MGPDQIHLPVVCLLWMRCSTGAFTCTAPGWPTDPHLLAGPNPPLRHGHRDIKKGFMSLARDSFGAADGELRRLVVGRGTDLSRGSSTRTRSICTLCD